MEGAVGRYDDIYRLYAMSQTNWQPEIYLVDLF